MGILEQVHQPVNIQTQKFPLDKRIMKIFLSLVAIFVFVVVPSHGQRYHNQIVCEKPVGLGNVIPIQCEDGKVIKVRSANYGRTYPSTCGQSSETSCYAPQSMSIVSQNCDGKQSCILRASNSIFGDPCFGVEKYLEVAYRCEYAKDALETCINKCEDNGCRPDIDKTVGCNQMYSCSHACVMRSRGVPRDQCIANCQRNGQSGCNPTVKGKTFDLCRGCNRQGCSRFPTVGECVAGCFYYVNF